MRRLRRAAPGLVRGGVALLVLAFLVSRVGSGPFVAAVGVVTAPTVALALVLTLATHTVSALRWAWVARRLGRDLDLGTALPAYYRAGFLNQTLPGGILGDVQRAVRQRAVRPVVWERLLGQAVLLSVAGLVLLVVPSPVPRPIAGLGLVAVAGATGAAWHWLPRPLRTADLWRPVLWSAAAVAGHLALLLVALTAAAPHVALGTALPLLLAVLVASSLPTNLAGWGPREGAAAGLFAFAGLGAGTGITVATTYGVLSLLAALPGGLLLLADVRRPRTVPA